MNMKRIRTLVTVLIVLSGIGVSTIASAQSNADKALKLANQWQEKEGSAIRGPNGRILFVFGQSQPTIVCGLFLICDIAMEPGEFIDTVSIGDAARWVLNPARVGEGENVTDHILIKPEEAGLVTNLFVATNRRSYMMKLISTERDSMGQIGFLYGNSRVMGAMTNVAQDSSSSQLSVEGMAPSNDSDMPILPRPRIAPLPGQIITVDPTPVGSDVIAKDLNFEYTLAGDRVPWKPIRVYDDGMKTYIDFNKVRVQARELPVFLVNDTDNVGGMINYRYVSGQSRMIIDGLFDKGTLMLGKGRKAVKVFIYRDAAGRPVSG